MGPEKYYILLMFWIQEGLWLQSPKDQNQGALIIKQPILLCKLVLLSAINLLLQVRVTVFGEMGYVAAIGALKYFFSFIYEMLFYRML